MMKANSLSKMAAGLALAGLVFLDNSAAKAEGDDPGRHIERELIGIEVDALMEKFAELTKRHHKADLELLELRSEREFIGNEEDAAQVERRMRSLEVLMALMEEKRHEVREHLHHLAGKMAQLHHHGEEHHGEGHERAELEEHLEHLKREIEELRESGHEEEAAQLERRAEEIRHHLEAREEHPGEGHKRAKLEEHLEHLEREIEELREAGSEEEAAQLERKADEIREHLERWEEDEERRGDGDERHSELKELSREAELVARELKGAVSELEATQKEQPDNSRAHEELRHRVEDLKAHLDNLYRQLEELGEEAGR